MISHQTYTIPFGSLKQGIHTYRFSVDDSFFEGLEYSEVRKADMEIHLVLHKQSHMLVLDFHLTGTIHVMCDRCADYFDLPVSGTNQLIVKIEGTEIREQDDILCIPASENEIDLSHHIYEYICLLLPQRRIHTNETYCNQDVLKQLRKFSANEKRWGNGQDDSRWSKLKNLKLS
jgi:uncharacterized metal-binding protein YceD (DUF177 family)